MKKQTKLTVPPGYVTSVTAAQWLGTSPCRLDALGLTRYAYRISRTCYIYKAADVLRHGRMIGRIPYNDPPLQRAEDLL